MAHARDELVALREWLTGWNVAARDVALPWVAAISGVEQVVVGVDSPGQLRANLEALRRPLPDGLDRALRQHPVTAPLDVLEPTRWPRGAS